MRTRILALSLPVLAGGMLVLALIHTAKSNTPRTQLSPPSEPARAGYGSKIAGSGVAEAQSENIAVGSALSGVAIETYVTVDDVGKHVAKGAPLIRVDDRNLRAQLAAANTRVESAVAQLTKLKQQPRPEEIPPSEAQVRNASANAARLLDDYKRAQQTFDRGAITESQLIESRLTYEAAVHQWEQAKANHALLLAGAWKPDIDIADANVAQSKADVQQIQTEIERSIVRAPVDGQILQVNVRVGEYVNSQSGQPLFVIGALEEMHVRVDIDENDIPRFVQSAPAVAELRGEHKARIPLSFRRVEPYVIAKKSLTGSNTERVDTRVLPVIYAVADRKAPIYVGQQMDVFVDCERGEGMEAALDTSAAH